MTNLPLPEVLTGTGDALPANLAQFCTLVYEPEVGDPSVGDNCLDLSAASTDYIFAIECDAEDIDDVTGTDPSSSTTLTWTVTLSGLYSPPVIKTVQAGVTIYNPCADPDFAAIIGDDLEP